MSLNDVITRLKPLRGLKRVAIGACLVGVLYLINPTIGAGAFFGGCLYLCNSAIDSKMGSKNESE